MSDAHTAWSVRDGSLRGGLTSVTQTKDGYLWLGTGLGLLRFDGVRFLDWEPPTRKSLPRMPIYRLTASRDGGLWIAGAQGVEKLKAAAEFLMLANNQPDSARKASSGEIKLAREAGMRDARIADNPSGRTAPTVTTGLYGFIP